MNFLQLWVSLVFSTVVLFPVILASLPSNLRQEGHLAAELKHNRILVYGGKAERKSLAETSSFLRQKVVPNALSNPLPSSPTIANELSTYDFEYQIHGGGNFYGHAERRRGKETSGEYFVILPDLRRQVVRYYVDASGYHANVTYEPISHLVSTALNPQPASIVSNDIMLNIGDPYSQQLRRRSFKKVVRKRVPKKRRSSHQLL